MSGSNHCILDHCSVSWSIDEAFSSRSAQNITLQRTLISEALNVAGHQNYPAGTMHGYAASIGGDTGSFHHNLLAHCYGRNWSLAGGLDGSGFFSGRLDLTDNVVYNWGHRTTDGGAMEVNFVNNYYKPGAATDYFFALNAQYDNFPGTQRYYFAGNVMPGRFDETTQALGRTATASNGGSLPTYQNFVDAPFFASFITTQPARVAYKYVLSDVGCNQPALDDHDTRVIREARDGTFTYRGSVSGLAGMPDTQADVGGWEAYSELYRAADWDSDHDGLPDWWERIAGTNPNSPAADFSDANADLDGDGYTNLEDYLNWTAAPHYDCSAGGSIDIDLSRLSAGFSAGPQFVVSGAVGGTVSLLAGGTTARFTSTESASRLGRFQFTVTDTEGTSLTREVGIRVISAAVQGSSTLTALSLRSVSQSRSSPLIVGFSVSGTQRVLLRGVGPTLGAFGVASVLPDPVMEIYHRAGSAETMIASNDDWASGDVTALQAAFQAANTFALDRTSKDAALLTTITGVNSAFVYDTAGRSGVVMVELYDAGIDGASRLVGISARNLVGTGENVLIAGFVISGNASKRLLIRGVGPTLGSFGVPGALADPRLDVYDGANHLLTGNDDWGSGDVVAMRAAFTAASEFDLPSSSKDAALLVYLAPGLYSAVVSGVGGLTGEALIEIYEVP
jgi:predicted ribosomally synthesized peptide with SipW-like signal peptide